MSPSKYQGYTNQTYKKKEIHPIWRGVGFAFAILIPIMAWAAMDIIMQQNSIHNWFPLTPDVFARPGDFIYSIIPDPLIYIKMGLFVFTAFFFYLILLMLSAIVTRVVMGNPEQSDPFYVRPMARQPRRRR